MVQRIDANTEDVVDNVEGAQRELMKYWSRVSGNRWLVAKMFGVLMVRKFVLDGISNAKAKDRFSFSSGFSLQAKAVNRHTSCQCIFKGVYHILVLHTHKSKAVCTTNVFFVQRT